MSMVRVRAILTRTGQVLLGVGLLYVIIETQCLAPPATYRVLVHSAPTGASIAVNGMGRGETPLDIELEKAEYRFTATKLGYETGERITTIRPGLNELEFTLVPIDVNVTSQELAGRVDIVRDMIDKLEDRLRPLMEISGADVVELQAELESTREELEKLRRSILEDPEDSLSLPILRGEIRNNRRELEFLRSEVIRGQELSKWFIGTLVATLMGMIGIFATLILSRKER